MLRANKIINIFVVLFIASSNVWAVPSNSISTPNSFSSNTVIQSSQVNANFNEVQTKFNNHTHTDINQLGTVTVGVWAATPIQPTYIASGGGAITGEVRMWAGTTVNIPTNWLACDGSAVSRTTYASLFAIIGTNYGIGNGTTTFNLPNWNSGKLVKGSSTAGTSAGATTQTATGTTDSHVITTGELPASPLTVSGSTTNGSANTTIQFTTNGGGLTTMNTSNLGTGGGHTHTFTSGSFSIEYSNQTAIFIIKT